ncbi:hypothetical protein GGF40_001188 [Coemansia sp. RSA 1286]|nr:hypothetical protein IWW45_009235 [Coemansia sp. RSA 485]KAJ2601613.1 hypothetical protein GGF39_001177 [Coemansia sp. RSA 1721]KAJ2639005.1 hypothetical protein GGF40_001188 [Coemansia sp. RSA 1286]KAJ2706242.1 hypothetical protein FB645_001758 [Coemansia sp. IMI 203386]
MKHIIFRLGPLPVPREAAPLITMVSGALVYGIYSLGKAGVKVKKEEPRHQ